MSHWNHRVNKIVYPTGETEYAIHEVYYNEHGVITSLTEDAVPPAAETVEELKQTLTWMLESLDKPIICGDELFPK